MSETLCSANMRTSIHDAKREAVNLSCLESKTT